MVPVLLEACRLLQALSGACRMGEEAIAGLARGPRGRGGPVRGISSGSSNNSQPPLRIGVPHVSDDYQAQPSDPTQEDDQDDSYSASDAEADGDHYVLDPDTLWFSHNVITKRVSDSIRAHYRHPWMNWTETPDYQKEHWLNIFKRKNSWSPEHEKVARDCYFATAARLLKGLASEAGTTRRRPKWMLKTVFDALMVKRSHPSFQKKSRQALENRRKGSEDGVIVPGHRNGSISTVETIERMALHNGGILPTPAQLFQDIRSSINADTGERVWVTRKAQLTMEKYEQMLAEYAEQGVDITPEEVWLKAVGGRKKGKIYGLGQSANLYYPQIASSSSSSTRHTSSFVSQLQRRLSTYEGEVASLRSQLEESKRATDLVIQKMEYFEATMQARYGGGTSYAPADSEYSDVSTLGFLPWDSHL